MPSFIDDTANRNPQREQRHALLLELLSTAGAKAVTGAHRRIAHRAEEKQLPAAACASCILLADRRTTLGAQGLAADVAPVLIDLYPGTARGALLAEIKAASRAFGHLRRQFSAAARAAKLQLCAAGRTEGVVLPHRLSAGRAERKATRGTLSMSQLG